LHLCFVEGYYPRHSGPIGGAGMYVQTIGRELVYLGHEVSVICAKMDNNRITYFKDGLIHVYPIMDSKPSILIYYISRVPIIKIFSGFLFYLHNGLKIHLFLRKLNYQNNIDYIEYSEGGDFWNTITNFFKYSSHLHGSFYTFKRQSGQKTSRAEWIRRRVEHFFIRRSHSVISPSKAMVRIVEKEMNVKLKNSNVIPYPIENFSKNSLSLVLNKNDKVIIFFASRNDPVKGGELFIRALKQIPDDLKNRIFVEIYGFKPEQDIVDLDFIKLNQFIPRDDLIEQYKRADICVIPSLFDNSPNTVYEAMASGKVVVASAVGGIPEIIGGIENGFLFNPFDINDLIQKITDAVKLVLSGNSEKIRISAQNRIYSFANLKNNTKQRLSLILN
jgi:glycosyltransferase involved in cell wall biosynthesis